MMDSLRYTIFNGFVSKQNLFFGLHGQSYSFWSDFWAKIYRDVGNLEGFHVDDFFRQHFVSVVSAGEKPVGIVMNSCFELDSPIAKNHSYFKYYPPEILESLRCDGLGRLMTFEFLTISPDWRKQKIGFSLGEVMMGLSQQIFLECGAESGLAVARTDVRAIEIVKRVGFFPILEGLNRKNFPVDVVVCTRQSIKRNDDVKAQTVVDQLWANRNVAREFNFDRVQSENLKKAA